MTSSRDNLLSPESDGDYLDRYLARIPVKLTSTEVGTGQFDGLNLYAWTEQQWDSSLTPQAYADADSPREGTFTSSVALEKNNSLLTLPFFASLRIIGWYNGEPLYEIESSGASSSNPFVGCRLDLKADTSIFNTNTVVDLPWASAGNPPAPTTLDFDTDAFLSSDGGTTLSAPKTGHYSVECNVVLGNYSTGVSASLPSGLGLVIAAQLADISPSDPSNAQQRIFMASGAWPFSLITSASFALIGFAGNPALYGSAVLYMTEGSTVKLQTQAVVNPTAGNTLKAMAPVKTAGAYVGGTWMSMTLLDSLAASPAPAVIDGGTP